MPEQETETRQLSASIFGAEKFAEVVLAYELERPGAVPLKHLFERTNLPRNLLNPILNRLVDSGVLQQLPRVSGSRGPVAYDVANEVIWDALVSIARLLDHSVLERGQGRPASIHR